jgi:hypothetical protein
MHPSLSDLQAGFLAILPRVRRHAAVYFRDLSCPGKRADAIAETVAIAWRSFVELARQGRDASRFASALATYAARNVRCGRWLCGAERPRDALSARAQRLHSFTLSPLPEFDTVSANEYGNALVDNTAAPVPDQARFRIDFADWYGSWDARDRRILDGLAQSERVAVLARQLGLTRARVYQLRAEFAADWARFYDEAPAEAPPAGTAVPALAHAV